MADGRAQETRLPPPRLSPRARRFVVGAYLLIAAVVVLDLATGPRSTFSPILAAVPVLAAIATRKARVPLLAGLAGLICVGLLSLANQGVPAIVHATSAVTVLAVTFTSTATVILVAARERELAQVRSVAETAQKALLRAVPRRIGPFRIAVRYLAAAAEARIGGDLYEVLPTEHGTRLLLGDVRGKGLAAVEAAVDVLGVFRDAARAEPDLAAVADRLDAALALRGAGEEFVTAVLATLPDDGDSAVVVNCGHPPPMLLHAGSAAEVEPPSFAPPLALLAMVGGGYTARPVPLTRGDLLLFYTDGLSEARDAESRFYPLAERLTGMPQDDPDALLDRLVEDVRHYVHGGLDDDAALVAVRREL
ncbi:serine/threonine-protein phosphatase [Streptomyces sp. RB6PN25]|uniref:Serine/threonine-protein phosphatase n=1 Tax=Streptomyces humicola TaxID=2953240 RepID=A0ABT1PSW3_9ACTN|nr:PP2C family protein-serine/threonine phosphatase [Streptomyces humicola]MCQ4079640.1 serine/threonine-protein phosphatase [Streptomyces humicola]